ncbi:MAG: T9SS type A sorting domain-containing protein [Saprospiraceae bacterium]|nr:T9SS type A sorting domain-containing protein [Saprospiraceae bacterium]
MYFRSKSKAKSEIQINISPNPFKHNVTFTIESPKSVDARLSIFNSNAQEIYTKQFNVSNRMYPFEVDLSNSPAGLLFWRLTIADNVSTGKLVHID